MWAESIVTGLFEEQTDLSQTRVRLADLLGHACLTRLQVQTLEDRIWERVWLAHFGPMRFGRRLWITPTDQAIPTETGEDTVVVTLDPGLAFGTGTHETTALCLEWLDSAVVGAARVIDYGCGSGILAIAAAMLGAREVWAVDIDEQALTATFENARRNGVAERVRTVPAGKLKCSEADIMLANILSEPLIALAPELANHCKAQAKIVLSGILSAQAPAVVDAFRPHARLERGAERGGWVRLQGAVHRGM